MKKFGIDPALWWFYVSERGLEAVSSELHAEAPPMSYSRFTISRITTIERL